MFLLYAGESKRMNQLRSGRPARSAPRPWGRRRGFLDYERRTPEGAELVVMPRLPFVHRVHRFLKGILDCGAEAERIGDDHGDGDRGHEGDQQAVLHEVLAPLVADELLYGLKHVTQP